jgi:hypothetical protein
MNITIVISAESIVALLIVIRVLSARKLETMARPSRPPQAAPIFPVASVSASC